MENKICAKCGSDMELAKGGSGAWVCCYCRGNKDALHQLRKKAWTRSVSENEKRLVKCCAAAREAGLSYGEYMAKRKG